MIHQIITLAVWGRGHCEGEGAVLPSIYYKIKLHFPEPIKRGPEGWNGFHLVFSPSISVNWKQSTLLAFINAVSNQLLHSSNHTSPYSPLWGFLGTKWDSSSFVVGHKITETNCSWHKFFKLLFFLQKYTILLHFTTNILLKLTIVQPFSLAL